MSEVLNRYEGLHTQILHDLERYFTERIEHYQYLNLLQAAYKRELGKVRDAALNPWDRMVHAILNDSHVINKQRDLRGKFDATPCPCTKCAVARQLREL
jgi:hypothetical protein